MHQPYKRKTEHEKLLKNNDYGMGSEESENESPNKPSLAHLSLLVKKVVEQSSWWERYGIDISMMIGGFATLPVGLLLLRQGHPLKFVAGFLLLGYVHSMFTVKLGHAAIHNSLIGQSVFWNRVFSIFFVEFWGGFTELGAHEAHIQLHHPYTNVIGLGDSSTFRAPGVVLDRYTFLFVAPIFIPIIYTAVAVSLLGKRWFAIARVIGLSSLGYFFQLWLYMNVSGLSFSAALLCVFFIRSVYAIPYIHVSVFQHIGLPMYDPKKKPVSRLHQMSVSVLNLPRNPLLDYNFGHSVINCHVEHHLFPQLSDNMCLKLKSLVSNYLRSNGLPYNEDTYVKRLRKVYNEYEELMVNAPPITELVGIQ